MAPSPPHLARLLAASAGPGCAARCGSRPARMVSSRANGWSARSSRIVRPAGRRAHPRRGLVAVVVGFGAWWTYFDFAGGRRPRPERAASLRWVLGHLPLTAAVAAMGAAMLSLVDHARDGRTPAATAWVLCAGAAVVLAATMLLAAGLPAWDRDRGLYRPLARTCAGAGVACLVLGAARPSPLILGLVLVLLLSVPWVLAVARRLARETSDPSGR